MPDKNLVNFILKARARGFDDLEIKEALLSNGWDNTIVEQGFASLKPMFKYRNKVCIYLDSDVLKKLDKRAKRNLFTLSEQIEDILRRSVVNTRQSVRAEKLDDMLVGLFSRKTRKRV